MRGSEDIEVILFDVDGTLFDQREAHRRALYQIKERYDVFKDIDMDEMVQTFREIDKEAIEGFRNGVSLNELRWKRSENFLKELGISQSFTETFHEEFYRIYPSIPAEVKGAKEVVEYLKPRCDLGVLSNSTEEVQMKKLQTLELTKYFDEFIFSEEVGSRKPDRGIFLHALEKFDKSIDRFLYVGNSFRSDVRGAMKVGMKACWLNRSNEKKGDGPTPTLEIQGLVELLNIY